MQTQPITEQAPRAARIPEVEPERSAPRAKPDARAERTAERKPVKATEPVPPHNYGAGF